jgi:carboxypeptidase C (cathepsin A)
MKKNLLAIAMFFSAGLFAQQRQSTPSAAPASAPSQAAVEQKATNNNIPFNPDHYVSADHEITIKGTRVPYKTVTGMMPVWDAEGKVQAGVFFTYYERSDVKDRAARPLLISFNGGPGTSSLWLKFHPNRMRPHALAR